MGRTTAPAKRRQDDEEMEITASETPPHSAKSRRKSNSDCLLLTKSGCISLIRNEVNAKYDSGYRNSENTNTLLGRRLTLGQACWIIGVALFGPDIPLEESGFDLHIYHILYIDHILHILHMVLQ